MFQHWVRSGKPEEALRLLTRRLHEHGKLNLGNVRYAPCERGRTLVSNVTLACSSILLSGLWLCYRYWKVRLFAFQVEPDHALAQAADLADGSAARQRAKPLGIGRVLDHVPVPIRCAIRPPWLATFAERDLRLLNLLPRLLAPLRVPGAHGGTFSATSFHQRSSPVLPLLRRQRRVRAAPQAPSHDEVPSVRGCRMGAHFKVSNVSMASFTAPDTCRCSPTRTHTFL